jgi:uncharacterized glyoxalase superfamily protein PhnB
MSLQFHCADVMASLEHYTEVFGFTLRSAWPSEEQPQWASLHLEGQVIKLGATLGNDQGPAKEFHQSCEDDGNKAVGSGVLAYPSVDDVDGYYEELLDRCARVGCASNDEPHGLRSFIVHDLNGCRLAIYAHL